MLVSSLRAHLACYSVGRFRCVDPPITTTRTLYSLGFRQYEIRKFWATLSVGEHKVPIYRYSLSNFYLEIEHSIGVSNHYLCGKIYVPIDELDAKREKTSITPRTHILYFRLVGKIENNMIKVNAVRLACIMHSFEPEFTSRFLNTILEAYGNPQILSNLGEWALTEIRKWRGVLAFILPKIPENKKELYNLVPLIWYIAGKPR